MSAPALLFEGFREFRGKGTGCLSNQDRAVCKCTLYDVYHVPSYGTDIFKLPAFSIRGTSSRIIGHCSCDSTAGNSSPVPDGAEVTVYKRDSENH